MTADKLSPKDHLLLRLNEHIHRGGTDRAQILGLEILAKGFVSGISASDFDLYDPKSLTMAINHLMEFASHRQPGRMAMRIFDIDANRPKSDKTSGSKRQLLRTCIEIVNDDMPFLVDSVAAELNRLGLTVHLMVHPILRVVRDDSGRLISLITDEDDPRARQESVMHIEIERILPQSHDAITRGLTTVLGDVRRSVDDWHAMGVALVGAAHWSNARGVNSQELDESASFLAWLHDDHFTFLGYRYFALNDDRIEIQGPGLGLLQDPDVNVFDDTQSLSQLPTEVHQYLMRPNPVVVTKSARQSTVHRPVLMDVIGIKRYSDEGRVIGLHAFVGLFTAVAYTASPGQIPLLRRKVTSCVTRAGFPPHSHDARALINILETYPRDELFQISEDALFKAATSLLRLLDRPRTALFVRPDEFGRFVSCMVYLPRDRYDTPVRLMVRELLERSFDGHAASWTVQVAELPLARLHVIIRTKPGHIPMVDTSHLEAEIAALTRSWPEQLHDALVRTHGETDGGRLSRLWSHGFSVTYRDRNDIDSALADIDRLEQLEHVDDLALSLCADDPTQSHKGRLKLYRTGESKVPLTEILPMLEAMGLRIIGEIPCIVRPAEDRLPVWIHEFEVESTDHVALDCAQSSDAMEQAILAVWRDHAESDGFNRLVLSAGLHWRQVALFRAYAKYLRQAGSAYSQPYMERALAANPSIAKAMVALFEDRFDPAFTGDRDRALADLQAQLAKVESADDDRILRRFLNLIQATLRTNAYQKAEDGGPKPYLSFKLDSHKIDDLPQPRPLLEIWIYSPRVEAIHLRGGHVARGGIRWSDRREDFRTEILGLMKAQMVKNTVIVPVGAKGGFVVKRPPTTGGREAFLAEGIECYRTLIRGLLDITDNLSPSGVIPPMSVVRRDDDDPYLVVAADKGTATFSDIANAISVERGFWLGDAFASGGSRGYDHKIMGITARGAWEAVKRHFREMGLDCQTDAVTAIGVGDMSGDVFGNGLLQSKSVRLLAAFNHAHIFIDPNPNVELAYGERLRLFKAVKSWPEYDPALISSGGGVFARSAKSISVSPEMKALLGLGVDSITPTDLIRVLLTHKADLLFFGGIGTYVKAHGESNADVGDRANDSLRVNGRDIRAAIIGEGANLGMTQLGRIEAAHAGVRLNTDAIDNSAGVDTSDHEVNIKILVDGLVVTGRLPAEQRDTILAKMTNEVSALVLRDNYLQTLALTTMQSQAVEQLDALGHFMRKLEKKGRLDRPIEFLPDDETLLRRAAAKTGFVRPELAVLLGYAKLWLYDEVLGSDLPDDPALSDELAMYFPSALRGRFVDDIPRHRLRREIIATQVTNNLLNRVGVAFVSEMEEKTGHGPVDIARAFMVARDAYRLSQVWMEIEGLDGIVSTGTQTMMLTEVNRLLERVIAWVLRWVQAPYSLGQTVDRLRKGVEALDTILHRALPSDLAEVLADRTAHYVEQGVPFTLATRVANLIVLASVGDILAIAEKFQTPMDMVGGVYFAVGARFGLGQLRAAAEDIGHRGYWEKLAGVAAMEDLYAQQRDIAQRVIAHGQMNPSDAATPEALMAQWAECHKAAVARCDSMLSEIRATGRADLAILAVAGRQLRALGDTGKEE